MQPALVAENRYAVIDVETNVVYSTTAEIIQIAVIQIDYGRPRFRTSCYIQPLRTLSPGAVEKHNITWDVLQHAPRFADVAAELLSYIGDRVLLGYNSDRFDYRILKRQLAEAGHTVNLAGLDVLHWERKLAGPGGKHNLTAAIERWELPLYQAHDAFDDARMTWNLFCRLCERCLEFGALPLADALTMKAIDVDEPVLSVV